MDLVTILPTHFIPYVHIKTKNVDLADILQSEGGVMQNDFRSSKS